MRRREFIAGLGGAVAWSVAARAQQAESVRRIGYLSFTSEMDQLTGARTTLLEALAKLGWVEGRNFRIDVRGAATIDRRREYAAELVKLSPAVIVTSGAATRTAARARRAGKQLSRL
jgi:putative tryptophan/tyrosine transport system substrate-binding protein